MSPWSSWLVVTVPAGIPFSESFTSSGFPAGWIQQNFGEDVYNGWALSPTTHAGGQAYEMACTFEDVVPGETRIVTPPINTVGFSELRLRFKHFMQAWEIGGAVLKIQTSTDKVNWTDEAWTVTTTTEDIGPETIDTTLMDNLNSETTFVAFVITGDLYYFDYWYIDDVSIARATVPKVDFNGDGEEDILWRYQGTGIFQGMNCIWLMNQTEGISAIPLGASQKESWATGLSTAASSGLSLRSPLGAGNPQASGSLKSSRSPMRVKDLPVLSKRSVKRSPMGIDRERTLRTKRSKEATLLNVPAIKDGKMARAAGDGTTGIASLIPVGYLYPQSVSDLGWEIGGAGDFDGDGDADILWRNYSADVYSGFNCIWYMNGAGVESYGYPDRVTDLDWRIVGTGDFDGDGNTDILWRNTGTGQFTGFNCIWYMSGGAVVGYAYPDRVTDLEWGIVGTGDFNGDGNTDILWRNTGAGQFTGFNCIWYMSGGVVSGYAYPDRVLDLNWKIEGTGDFNRDGYTDIVWRYYGSGGIQGYNCVWYMQNDRMIGVDYPMSVPDTNWRIVNR